MNAAGMSIPFHRCMFRVDRGKDKSVGSYLSSECSFWLVLNGTVAAGSTAPGLTDLGLTGHLAQPSCIPGFYWGASTYLAP